MGILCWKITQILLTICLILFAFAVGYNIIFESNEYVKRCDSTYGQGNWTWKEESCGIGACFKCIPKVK